MHTSDYRIDTEKYAKCIEASKLIRWDKEAKNGSQ